MYGRLSMAHSVSSGAVECGHGVGGPKTESIVVIPLKNQSPFSERTTELTHQKAKNKYSLSKFRGVGRNVKNENELWATVFVVRS